MFNRRYILLKPLDRETEISMQSLKNKLITCTNQYIQNWKVTGKDKTNLTEEEENTLYSLQRKTDNLEMVIIETDKSKRFSWDSHNNYKLSGEQHISEDRIINDETKERYEKTVNAHSEMWLRMINAGKNRNQYERIKHSMLTKNCPPAPLTISRKDHKEYQSEEIGPPGRPVGGGDVTYNRRLSHLISIILKEIYKDENSVCSSTEEMIAAVDEVNERGIDSTYIIGSADVKALYPSLDIEFTIEVVCDMFNRSKVNIKNVNYKEVALYIALNRTDEEIRNKGLSHICPKRKYRRGPRPNITGCGINEIETERYEPWIFPEIQNINENEKRRLMIEALRIVLNVILKTHTYKFDGITRVQMNGGPIGMELTGDIAQIFMVWWDGCLKRKMEEIGLRMALYERYVDDINLVMKRIEKGQRYENGILIQNEVTEIEDENTRDDERTMKSLKTIGQHTCINQIRNGLPKQT